MQLLTTQNPKMIKGEKFGYLTFIMHLSPALSSGFQVCPNASNGCIYSCLNLAGRGVMKPVREARIKRTRLFFEYQRLFMDQLVDEITKGIKKAYKKNLIPVIRLNGTSDICWEKIRTENHRNIMENFPSIQFYDYTKILGRKNLPQNYHLTFSRSETNLMDCIKAFKQGLNIAIVFRNLLPKIFSGLTVFNGDDSDLRFLDPPKHIIGLIAKGRARKDATNFVIN